MNLRRADPSQKEGNLKMSGALGGAITFTVDEVLEKARISRGLFYKIVRQGKGPKMVRMGRRTFVTPRELDAWIDRLQRGSHPPKFSQKSRQVTEEVATAA
jgi:predicted DNA-binding transcriptional regulator AlpA